jgi:hypothetical protein
MPTLSSLTPVLPVLAALMGATLVIATRLRQQTLTSASWILWSGVAGGTVATAGLSAEWLNVGTGGTALAAVGGVVASALMSTALVALGGPRMWHQPGRPRGWRLQQRWRRPDPFAAARGAVTTLISRVRRRRLAVVVGLMVALGGVGLATLDLAWLGVLLLLGIAAVGLTSRGWSPVTAFFLLASVVSAVVVVTGQLVLTRFHVVGHAVPVTSVVAITLLPLLCRAVTRGAWRAATARLGLIDCASVLVAATAGLTWWNLLHPLGQDATVSQLMRLGEDNLSHLLMLRATQDTGDILGSTPESLASAERFVGYFTGSSTWQASVGGLVGSANAPDAYVVSTAVLLAMIAGLGSAAATLARPACGRVRLAPLAAIGVLAVGVVATRATLAMYELGFPGQLLVATFFLSALMVLVRNRSAANSAAILLLLTIATWWTWSLAALVLLVPVGILAVQHVRGHRWVPDRVLTALIICAGVVGLAGMAVKRARIVAILDELNLEGAIFRGIPTWVAFSLVLALPLALQLCRRQVPPAATGLVLAAVTATLLLSLWQVVRVGMMTYYGYKLEYFVLALGWATGSMAIAALLGTYEVRLEMPWRAAAAAMAILAAVPLVTWTTNNYRGWLTARGALGVDQATVCAIRTARGLSPGSVAVATGFGEPISNYLATRAMDVGTGTTASSLLWGPILSVPNPTDWPWSAVQRPVVVVQGPAADPETTRAVVSAARTAGVAVTVGERC